MSAPYPTRYRLEGSGFPAATYLCFRVTEEDGRQLFHFIPDAETQHPLDIALFFRDDPRIHVVDDDGEREAA